MKIYARIEFTLKELGDMPLSQQVELLVARGILLPLAVEAAEVLRDKIRQEIQKETLQTITEELFSCVLEQKRLERMKSDSSDSVKKEPVRK